MISRSTIRLFVSSTFADMKAERDLLQREVFPRLRKTCLELGLRFQAIDLRWGVSEEAGRDNRTMRICLRELKRCQSGGPKPNFLILLGDRYGWCPLPEILPAELFEKLKKGVSAEDTKTAELLNSAYRRDDNAVPPAYVLQPQPREAPFDNPKAWWPKVGAPLLAALQRAVTTGGLEKEAASLHLGISATHQEILHGALNLPPDDVRQHVHAFVRTIRFPEGKTPDKDFVDCRHDGTADPVAAAQVETLRADLKEHLSGDNLHSYTVDWREKGEFHDEDLKQFHDDIVRSLEVVIIAQAKANEQLARSADLENEAHGAFAAERRAGHVGHNAELARAAAYLASNDTRPLLVLGPPGSGKTAFIAEVTARARLSHSPSTLVIERYISATPGSSRAVSLLHDLVQQIRAAYPKTQTTDAAGETKPDTEIPAEFNPLGAAFHEALKRVTPEKPLLLFLDALDQLAGDTESIGAWFSTTLPLGARMILSTALPSADGARDEKSPVNRTHSTLTGRLPLETHLCLPPLKFDHGAQMLDRWLAAASRMLTPRQRAAVLSAFTVEGNPLWLRTATAEASRWPSWDQPAALPPTTPELIRRLLDRLSSESEHGPALVERTLGYLACSRHGLSEDELLDLLSCKEEEKTGAVMADFHRRFPRWKDLKSLPVATWVPLLGDLMPFLGEQDIHGVTVMRFYHRVLSETVERIYFETAEARRRDHRVMAEYFTVQARGPNATRPWESTNTRGFAECVYHQARGESWEIVAQTLSDFGFLMQKTRLGLLEGLFDDWSLLDARASAETKLHLQISRAFFRQKANILRRSSDDWPAYKILLQLAIEHADDSPLTHAAERWLADGGCDWPWLRRNRRPSQVHASACLAVLEGHLQPIYGAIVLAKQRLLSWADDDTLRVWDSVSGRCVAVLKGHSGRTALGARELADGRLVSWSPDKTLRLWDAESGQCLAVLEGHSRQIMGARELPDGRLVSWSCDKTLRLWDCVSGRCVAVLEGHSGMVFRIQILADGRILSCSDDKTLRLWDAESGQCLASLEGHSGPIMGTLELAGGGLASWSRDKTLRLWNSQSGQCIAVLEGHSTQVKGALELADQRLLSWSDDKTLRLWDSSSGQGVAALEGHTGQINGVLKLTDRRFLSWGDKTLRQWDSTCGECLAVFESPSGQVVGALRLAAGRLLSWGGNTMQVWDLGSGQCLTTFEIDSYVGGAVALADGRFVSWSGDKNLRLWDTNYGGHLAPHDGHSGRVQDVLTLANKRLLSWSVDRALLLWDSVSGRCLARLEGHLAQVRGALTLGDRRLVSWSNDGTLRLWDSNSGRCVAVLRGHADQVEGACEIAANRLLLSWSADNTLRIWDLRTATSLATLEGHTGLISGTLTFANGLIVSWADGLIRWDLNSGEGTSLEGHTHMIVGARALADGRLLSWSNDNTLRLWSVITSSCLVVLEGHAHAVMGALELTDGRILSWSSDQTLRLWDSRSGKCLMTFVGHSERILNAREIVGERILSYDCDRALRLWDINTGRCLETTSWERILRKNPEWLHAPSNTDAVAGDFFVQHFDRSNYLLHKRLPRSIFSWNAESISDAECLYLDGTMVVTLDDGQVCFVQLFHGNRRISLDELEKMILQNGPVLS